MALLLDEGPAITIVIGSSASLLTAALFSLIVGPFLGGWRRSMKDDEPWLYGGLSALLCAGLLLWTLFTLPALFLVAVYLVGADIGAEPWTELLPALDHVLDGVGLRVLALAWLSGLVCCLECRRQYQLHRVHEGGSPLWRKVLGALLFVPYALALFTVGGVVWGGLRLDPQLRAAYSEEIALVLDHKVATAEEALVKTLPPGLGQSSMVLQWANQPWAPVKSWNEVLELWCREASKLWAEDAFWKNPHSVAMAELVVSRGVIEREDLDPALRAEAMVRSAAILLDRGGVSQTMSQRLFELELPEERWKALVELALERRDILQGAELTDEDVRHKFIDGAVRVLSKGDHDMDGRLQRRFFQRCQERSELNSLWRGYQDGKPYPKPEAPLGREQFQARYQASIDFDLKAIDHDIFQVTFEKELARQNLAYDIVVMELQRLQQENGKLPRSWEQFRPEVAKVGKAYRDWMALEATPEGVRLRRLDPWQGMSLIHRFMDG